MRVVGELCLPVRAALGAVLRCGPSAPLLCFCRLGLGEVKVFLEVRGETAEARRSGQAAASLCLPLLCFFPVFYPPVLVSMLPPCGPFWVFLFFSTKNLKKIKILCNIKSCDICIKH